MTQIICDRCGAICENLSHLHFIGFKKANAYNFDFIQDENGHCIEVCDRCLFIIQEFVKTKIATPSEEKETKINSVDKKFDYVFESLSLGILPIRNSGCTLGLKNIKDSTPPCTCRYCSLPYDEARTLFYHERVDKR